MTRPANLRTLRIDDVELAYRVDGEGPAVVLIQGVGVAGRGWAPQVEALARRHRVITCDSRGVGGSTLGREPLSIERMAADVAAILDAERIDRAHLAGHSMGGLIALQLAVTDVRRVASLALLCTFAHGPDVTRLTWRMLLPGLRCRVGTRAMRRLAMMRLIFPDEYLRALDPAARASLVSHVQDLFGRDLADQPPILAAQLRAMSRASTVDRLPRLAGVPTLVVSAAHDPIAPPALGRALAQAIGGASFVEVAGASHALPIQCAGQVNGLLCQHLAAAERAAAERAVPG